jgi:hypothetical protein
MNFKALFTTLLIFSFFFFGCDPQKNTPAPGPTTGMTAKVDGSDWKAAVPVAKLDSGDVTLMGATLSGQAIGLHTSKANITQPGTYAAIAVYSEVIPGEIDGPTWANRATTLTITKLDLTENKISGTFGFSSVAEPTSGATGTRTITNGVFTDIPLQF